MHEHVDINDIIDTINNFDKVSMVDNIYIYPKITGYKIRNDFVPDLPWQKKQKEKHQYYLRLREGTYVNESLVHFGMMLLNDRYNTVKQYDGNYKIPYTFIDEGIVFHLGLTQNTRYKPNVRVYREGKLVFEKMTTENGIITEFHDEQIYDYYNETDRNYIEEHINKFDTNRKIYLFNTETVKVENEPVTIAGLASGNVLAELAYTNQSTKVIYFDFSQDSLDFQEKLINSNDRLQLYKDNISNMTLGYHDATMDDIDKLDIESINSYYDYLKNIDVEFVNIDLRKDVDIERLFSVLPNDTVLWISNVLSYITTFNDYSVERYNLIDRLCGEKNITLLPHTRIYYES
jgi:hypothetical protein